MVGGGDLTWLAGALRLRLRVGVRSACRGSFVVVDGGASMLLKGAIQRGWRGRFAVVGGSASTSLEGGRLECLEGELRFG